ncbi:MAG: hypothetical protein DMF78_09280 [Acidobacteria bacterium]|nr:MAG: hypothetical protein DMF78_09280 [Acidobacteriota bacterium]
MGSPFPQLDELIRELSDVCALPEAETEPALSAATIAVSKVTTALTQATRARGRAAETALEQAMAMVADARAALERARQAIHASAARRRRLHPADDRSSAPGVEGQVETTCPSCGRDLVVRYRAGNPTPVIAFPIACPFDDCEGVAAVEYPASAVDVAVEAPDSK